MPGAFSFVQLPPCYPERKAASYGTFQSVRGITRRRVSNENHTVPGHRRAKLALKSPDIFLAPKVAYSLLSLDVEILPLHGDFACFQSKVKQANRLGTVLQVLG